MSACVCVLLFPVDILHEEICQRKPHFKARVVYLAVQEFRTGLAVGCSRKSMYLDRDAVCDQIGIDIVQVIQSFVFSSYRKEDRRIVYTFIAEGITDKAGSVDAQEGIQICTDLIQFIRFIIRIEISHEVGAGVIFDQSFTGQTAVGESRKGDIVLTDPVFSGMDTGSLRLWV